MDEDACCYIFVLSNLSILISCYTFFNFKDLFKILLQPKGMFKATFNIILNKSVKTMEEICIFLLTVYSISLLFNWQDA